MVGTAVNVTFVPEQMEVDGLAEITTLAVTFAVTVIVMVLDVAGLPVTHEALLVITHEIVFPLTKVASVYVGLFVPTLPPFFFH